MKAPVHQIKKAFEEELLRIESVSALEQLKIKYLGKKGAVLALMPLIRDLEPSERPAFGEQINALKQFVLQRIETLAKELSYQEMLSKIESERIDITLPGARTFVGRKHPIMQMLDQMIDILLSMGFSVQYSSEIEDEYYNYEGLNYPEDHPARDMQDTFYIDDKRTLLRSHCTSIQQHLLENHSPPIRVVAPGKCYRNETITSRSHVFFYQVDVVYIDKGVSFADLLATQEDFYSKVFNQKVEMRVRPSYFPFVEPGIEVDIRCTCCQGKGCVLCKQAGYLEVAGAGMVHPNILKTGGLDPDIYSGYAWGGGVERLFMLLHQVEDIRLFTQNDVRFLAQF